MSFCAPENQATTPMTADVDDDDVTAQWDVKVEAGTNTDGGKDEHRWRESEAQEQDVKQELQTHSSNASHSLGGWHLFCDLVLGSSSFPDFV